MPNIKSILTLQDNMSNTLVAIEKSALSMEKSLQNIDNKLNSTDKTMQKATGSSDTLFNSLLRFNLLSNVFSMITGQIGSAITRFDTLNNYTKVMGNLGFEAEASERSIARLKEGLDGLPTTLQDSVSSVQRFASSNENVEASTEMFLALNDAILAGGSSAMSQASALEQVSQAYAKGKFDAMEWRTMMTAMPAQLKQVAKQMGYTNIAVGGDFYKALQTGEIGMNDFMKTLVELDTAEDGFQKQAKDATGGIQTAFTNMRTAITKGLTDMIEKINKSLEDAGLPTIQEMITSVGKTIQNFLSQIGDLIGELISRLAPFIQFLQDNISLVEMFIIVIAAWAAITKIMAVAQAILNSQLLIPILIIGTIITMIYLVIQYINEVTGASISAVGVIVGGLSAGAAIIQNIFIGLYNVLLGIVNGIALLFANMAESIVSKIHMIAQAIDFVFGSNLSATTQSFLDSLDAVEKDILENGGYKDFKDVKEAYNSGYEFGEKIDLGIKDIATKTDAIGKSTIEWDKLANNVTGTDAAGGKALKTTSNDNLLSDEDIQMLLDIATRDYQLNYQQVTPNVTVSFGDVRETADVNQVLDAVGTRIEELIYGDAEVVY